MGKKGVFGAGVLVFRPRDILSAAAFPTRPMRTLKVGLELSQKNFEGFRPDPVQAEKPSFKLTGVGYCDDSCKLGVKLCLKA